jgi:hypothetical protein
MRTTNLTRMVSGGPHAKLVNFSYLWKMETQLIAPLAHCASYAANLGYKAWINGPVNGILNSGPVIDPFLFKYITIFQLAIRRGLHKESGAYIDRMPLA